MGWADTHPWQVRKARRSRRRLEAALVGATGAIVFLILEPPPVQAARREAVATIVEATQGPPAIAGRAEVIDGDGLRIGDHEIRLNGIDAFELHQACDGRPCGSAARTALRELVRGQEVACRPVDTDGYGRTVATCRAGRVDLGAEMVRTGHALAYRRYSNAYVDEEARARRASAGAWAGAFTPPEDWRRAHPRD